MLHAFAGDTARSLRQPDGGPAALRPLHADGSVAMLQRLFDRFELGRRRRRDRGRKAHAADGAQPFRVRQTERNQDGALPPPVLGVRTLPERQVPGLGAYLVDRRPGAVILLITVS